MSPTATPSSNPSSFGAVHGNVHGGQQPVVGAHVYLLAGNKTGYGGDGIAASALNASLSLLTDASTGRSDAHGAYVLTDATGSFTITGDYTCGFGQQVYYYVLGGNPGAGGNSSLGLMSYLGTCGLSGAFPATDSTNIDEVSTVATAYALAGYATDATHISAGTSSNAFFRIADAGGAIPNLVNLTDGTANTVNLAGNATVPASTINTLANILSACVNSADLTSGGSTSPSTSCSTLLSTATSDGTSTGNVPADTASAAINIAHHPAANVAALYGLASPDQVFAPALTKQPNDFTLALTYTGGGFAGRGFGDIAIDSTDDIWVANDDVNSITEISSGENFVSGVDGYTGAYITSPLGLAIDLSDNPWFITDPNGREPGITKISTYGSLLFHLAESNSLFSLAIDGYNNAWISTTVTSQIFEFSNDGKTQNNIASGGGLNNPLGIAIDGSNDIWTANSNSNSSSEFTNKRSAISGSAGYTASGLDYPIAIAIDGSGNAWLTNVSSPDIVEVSKSGIAASPTGGYTGGGLSTSYDYTRSIAIDGAGTAWVATGNGGTVAPSTPTLVAISSSGTFLSGANGYSNSLVEPASVAIDGAGNVWVGDLNSVIEFIGAAVPVVTPLAAGAANNTLGTRP